MTQFLFTGSNGFLGWHTRVAARALGHDFTVMGLGKKFDLDASRIAVEKSDVIVHIAGVNRATDEEVLAGNLEFAQQLGLAIESANKLPSKLVFANSIQAGNGTVYGHAKEQASALLEGLCEKYGIEYVDIKLPNLFGEHGAPFYNSVTATFCEQLIRDKALTVNGDNEIILLHAQNAADLLLGEIDSSSISQYTTLISVSKLADTLTSIHEVYSSGDIPEVGSSFLRDLFNTYRSYKFKISPSIPLVRHEDARGAFFEIVRSHGGTGQSSFSTTHPGITRGNHYHRRKIERFTVLAGEGRIQLRKMFTNEILDIDVNGNAPVAVDMPTGWIHNITNTGTQTLYTSFWTNEIFDPQNPDTFAEVVDHEQV